MVAAQIQRWLNGLEKNQYVDKAKKGQVWL